MSLVLKKKEASLRVERSAEELPQVNLPYTPAALCMITPGFIHSGLDLGFIQVSLQHFNFRNSTWL